MLFKKSFIYLKTILKNEFYKALWFIRLEGLFFLFVFCGSDTQEADV